MRLRTAAAVALTTVLTTFGVAEASPPSSDPPASTDPPPTSEPASEGGTSTDAPTTVTVTVVESAPPTSESHTEPPEDTASDSSAPDSTALATETGTTVEPATSAVPTTNPQQVTSDQAIVITATVVANANTGSNAIVDEQPSPSGSQLPADIGTGDATAVGSNDQNVIAQGADVVLSGQATANVLQVALILNIGVALANSGFNTVLSSPGGTGAAGDIATGDASATGLQIDQYVTQAARGNGDADTDSHVSQVAISMWMGVASANSGTNTVVGTSASGGGGSVQSGGASATGNDSVTEIEQYAEVLGLDQSTINVTQRATVLNVGFALANSGFNDVAGVAGGLLSASDADDDAIAQDLFAMLLPALLQGYGYGPAQGTISSGGATAVGNESETFVRQVAMAASSGDGVVDIVQDVMVANVGAAAANTGGNSLGGVRQLDSETANAVVTMAAFMAELLSLVHQSATATTLDAASRGIEVPFQGLILRLDGAFEGLDTQVSQGGAQASLRQVSLVVSLGIAEANTGGNLTASSGGLTTRSEILQGNRVNSLSAGDAVAVLAVSDANGNAIDTGSAAAANRGMVVVMCQRLDAADVECLVPPTTTAPPTTSTTAPDTTDPATTVPDPSGPDTPDAGGAGGSSTEPTTPSPTSPAADPQNGFGHIPAGTLPATGTDAELPLVLGSVALLLGAAALLATRRRCPS